MGLNHEEIKEILGLLDASPFDEMQLETEGLKLSLRRTTVISDNVATPIGSGDGNRVGGHAGNSGGNSSDNHTVQENTVTESSETKVTASNVSVDQSLVEITAPMLGVFYRTPKPGADPYVTEGMTVEHETVVCLIEVMKLMNSVRAEQRGEIVEICVEDGQLVEYGQTLFKLKV